MKRKLLCIFFMLAGAAAIAGTILLSQGRPERADASPVYTLIILSIITIVAAAFHINEPYKPEVSAREKVFLRVFRAVGILAILADLAFIVIMFFLTDYYIWIRNALLLMVLAAAGIAAAALSLKVRPPIIGRDIAKAVVSLVIAAALSFVYLNYMPKYSQEDGVNLLRSEEEFVQTDVFYPDVYVLGEPTGAFPRWDDDSEMLFGGNPFYEILFQYYYDSYGYDADGLYFVKGVLNFNPATGAYDRIGTEKQVKTYITEEWPEFKYNFMYDEDGQRGAVLNLYFREWPHPDSYAAQRDPMLSVSSGEWDKKIKDVMYPHCFPEGEARAFMLSIGEEALKTKLLEQINDLGAVAVLDVKEDNALGLAIVGTKGKTVEVFFFGIDIATYQNGEIILKL